MSKVRLENVIDKNSLKAWRGPGSVGGCKNGLRGTSEVIRNERMD